MSALREAQGRPRHARRQRGGLRLCAAHGERREERRALGDAEPFEVSRFVVSLCGISTGRRKGREGCWLLSR